MNGGTNMPVPWIIWVWIWQKKKLIHPKKTIGYQPGTLKTNLFSTDGNSETTIFIHFSCKGLESSNWNNQFKVVAFGYQKGTFNKIPTGFCWVNRLTRCPPLAISTKRAWFLGCWDPHKLQTVTKWATYRSFLRIQTPPDRVGLMAIPRS